MTGTDPLPPATEEFSDWRRFVLVVGFLVLGFSLPLYRMMRFGLGGELYSHLILIPFISAYLVWLKRSELKLPGGCLPKIWSVVFGLVGGGMLAGYFFNLSASTEAAIQDQLAFAGYAFVLLLATASCWLLNRPTLRAIGFPLGFLLFIAPFPICVEKGLEAFLQHGSAPVAEAFFQLAGTPVSRSGTNFTLPNFITMQLAPECSGIHATLSLFITSLVAGRVLLGSNWKRFLLVVAVLPIALLRNGFRVAVIGELCVRIGREMFESYIHRHGGPIFFLLSLIPFSLLLFWLIRAERRRGTQARSAA